MDVWAERNLAVKAETPELYLQSKSINALFNTSLISPQFFLFCFVLVFLYFFFMQGAI